MLFRSIEADQVVVACGIWSQLLLAPHGLAPKLEVWPMLWAHYTVDPALAAAGPRGRALLGRALL